MYKFKKENGKWKSELDYSVFVNLFTTFGLPIEIGIDEFEKKPLKDKIMIKLNDWINFAKENKIDLDEIRDNNEKNKEEFIKVIEQINNEN